MSASYDEPHLVSSAGLLPAAAPAQKLGVAELVEARVRLAAGRGERRDQSALGVTRRPASLG